MKKGIIAIPFVCIFGCTHEYVHTSNFSDFASQATPNASSLRDPKSIAADFIGCDKIRKKAVRKTCTASVIDAAIADISKVYSRANWDESERRLQEKTDWFIKRKFEVVKADFPEMSKTSVEAFITVILWAEICRRSHIQRLQIEYSEYSDRVDEINALKYQRNQEESDGWGRVMNTLSRSTGYQPP